MAEQEYLEWQSIRGAKISKHWKENYEYHRNSIKNNSKVFMNSEKGKALARENLKVFNDAIANNEDWAIKIHRDNSHKGHISRWNDTKQHELASKRLTIRNLTDGYASKISKLHWESEKGQLRNDWEIVRNHLLEIYTKYANQNDRNENLEKLVTVTPRFDGAAN